MLAYQTLDGYFVGTTTAQESPVEAGVFLIPRGAVTVPPPEASEGQVARWVNNQWVLVPEPTVEPEVSTTVHTPPVLTLEQRRASMTCSAFQARAALLQWGLLDDVEAAVAAIGGQVALAWEFAIEWRRTSPTIASLAPVLNLSDEQLDQLFELAQTIEA